MTTTQQLSIFRRTPLPLAVLLSAAASLTQAPPATTDPDGLVARLVVPVHTQPADEIGGDYGIWAAGPRFKASFHDGFTYYPALGPSAPAHLPLGWRTTALHAGGHELPLGEGAATWSGCRLERDLGPVVEAYDVGADGVEQTFTLKARPAVAGGVVVTGTITTPLSCVLVGPAHRELTFRDGATDVIRYGAATAFDAGARRCAVLTSWDGEHIRLTVPAAFVAAAQFPVVIDPLIGSHALAFPLSLPTRTVITARPENMGRIVVAWVQATGGDSDLYAIEADRNFGNVHGIYTDITTAWSSLEPDATIVDSTTTRWIVSQRRSFGANSNHVRLYLHAYGNTTANSGTTLFPSAPSGFEDVGPVLGGGPFTGLVAATRVHTASGVRSVVGTRIAASSASLGTSMNLTAGFLEPLDNPRVTPMTYGSNSGWVVAALGTSGIRVGFVPQNGSGAVPTQLLVAATANEYFNGQPGLPSLHVAGADGRYLLDYVGV